MKTKTIILLALLGITAVITGCGPSAKDKQIAELQAKVADQQRTIEELKTPTVPVTVKWRGSKLNEGLVWQLINDSGKTLAVKVVLTNATFARSKEFDVVLLADQTKEIGHLEGWTASPADVMTLSAKGYRSVQKIIPEKRQARLN